MVRTQVLVIFAFCVIVGVKTADVIYRGTLNDGTYSEVRQSKGPLGETDVVSFSSRVHGENGKVPHLVGNRMFGLKPFGLPHLGGPGFPSPQNIFPSMIPQGPIPYSTGITYHQPPVVSSFQHRYVVSGPFTNGLTSSPFSGGLQVRPFPVVGALPVI